MSRLDPDGQQGPEGLLTRRGFLAPVASALAVDCSPLELINDYGPQDDRARRLAHDLRYGEHPRQRLDLWGPTLDPDGPHPILVFFRGGAWRDRDRQSYVCAARALAARGFLVAVPDYRLIPEVRFPAFIEDAAASAAFVSRIATRFGGDASRLGVLGHSAGAYLSTMVALDRRYMISVEAPGLIRAAAGLAGPYEFSSAGEVGERDAFGRTADPTLTHPITYVRADAPPLWLGHGALDTVVSPRTTRNLCRRLREAGGRCESRVYDGLSHEGLIATSSLIADPRATALSDVAAFFGRTLS